VNICASQTFEYSRSVSAETLECGETINDEHGVARDRRRPDRDVYRKREGRQELRDGLHVDAGLLEDAFELRPSAV